MCRIWEGREGRGQKKVCGTVGGILPVKVALGQRRYDFAVCGGLEEQSSSFLADRQWSQKIVSVRNG
eukprot:3487354-Rhodomonas_salina.1